MKKIIIVLLFVSYSLSGQVLKNIDFQTGDLTQVDSFDAADHELKIAGVGNARLATRNYWLRLTINKDEYDIGGSKWRAEIKHYNVGVHNKEMWYSFNSFIPKGWNIDPLNRDIIFQIHDSPDLICEDYRKPPLSCGIEGNQVIWNVNWDSTKCSIKNVTPKEMSISTTNLDIETWTNWIIHVKWSYLEDGIIKIWKNGKLVSTHIGPNCYNDRREMVLKAGIYRAGWRSNEFLSRTLLIDDIKIGDSNCNYDLIK